MIQGYTLTTFPQKQSCIVFMQKDTMTRDTKGGTTHKQYLHQLIEKKNPCIIGEESQDNRFSTQQEEKTEQKIRKEEICNLHQNIGTTLGFV